VEVSTEQCTPHPRSFEGLTVEDFVQLLLMEHSFLLLSSDDFYDIYCDFVIMQLNSLSLTKLMVFLTEQKENGLP